MKKSVIVWMHVGFCCLYALYALARMLSVRFLTPLDVGQLTIVIAYNSPIMFYSSYFLMFLYFKNKKNLVFVAFFYVIVFLFPFFLGHRNIAQNVLFLLSAIPSSFFGALFYLAIDWFQKKQQKKELEKQNLQSELKLLKNQVNPHFLFNTLNNIDSLISSNPGKASAMLVGLSGMMRYMIYDTNAGKVPLEQELQQIRNYLDLQEMQFANAGLVEYTVIGNPEGIDVAPMLFIPFIENAFKHCTDKEKRHAIRFLFDIDEKTIRFKSVNVADPLQHITKDSTGGIGLETVKRRLELLYPDRHKLQIDRKNDLFSVFLSIDTQ